MKNVKLPYLYKRRYLDNRDISSEDLKIAYHQAAKLVAEHGEKYLPIFERLEKEMHNMQNKEAAIKRALEVATNVKEKQDNT